MIVPQGFIVTNFAYGTGPYLRTTELALAVNHELEARGRPRLGIIVPWVYGQEQKRIMREEFAETAVLHAGEILLDAKLGAILKRVFYGSGTYGDALRRWNGAHELVSREAREHLGGTISVEDLHGRRVRIGGSWIVLELARAPRISYGIVPVFAVTFGYASEILEHVLDEPEQAVAVERRLVRETLPVARAVEGAARLSGLAEPGTFSYLTHRARRYAAEVAIPPAIVLSRPQDQALAEGIYVTVTGIPGSLPRSRYRQLGGLLAEAGAAGLKLYTNSPSVLGAGERISPASVANPRIKLHVARSGWGSVWRSQLAGAPIVVLDFDPADDPEIYFNNRCIESLGLGIVYRGQSLQELRDAAERLRPGIAALNQKLRERFGTLDGNTYAARRIVELL